jgi:hypothetical protein
MDARVRGHDVFMSGLFLNHFLVFQWALQKRDLVSLKRECPSCRRHSRETLLDGEAGLAGIHVEAFDGCPLSWA